MTSPPQPSPERHHGVPTRLQSERVRVALVGGSGVSQYDDLYPLLRRRLLALNLFLAGSVAVVVTMILTRGPDPNGPYGATYFDILIYSLRFLVSVAIHLTVAWFLWRRPPRTLFGLRTLEFVTLTPMFVVTLWMSIAPLAYDYLAAAAGESSEVGQAYIGRYINAGGLLWFFVITAYGTLIPNTIRRAALITGGIAISPLLLFVIYATWVRPLEPAIVGEVLTGIGLTNAIAVVLVLFSTSRIEVLRQEAAEARKLGQYLLQERLGAGGMGEVYRADHALLRRPCAVKLIRPDQAGDPAALRRFEREVQVTATLTHPNTVQIFDYGHAADGTFYYVMEYLPGLTLDQIVRNHGPLPPGRAVYFLRQVCAALTEAHARGLTHRDIKPGNVMVCERGGVRDVVKLLDFGLVLAPKDDPHGATLTQDGAITGTPAFMSPEQAGGQDGIDPRSDLYSVGALAYFLLTGQPPFGERPTLKTLAAHLYESPPELPADVPPGLSVVVMKCLAKSPAERWPDAATLEAALTGLAVPEWTADEAASWWARVGSDRETGPVPATAIWAASGTSPGQHRL
jgi:eukaryotic-like serine/threonine-protein kinase